MIHIISCDNLQKYNDLYIDQFKLRHQEFIKRQSYEVREYNGMEFDEYDTPASVYLVYSLDGKKSLGVSRLIPTTAGCMLKEHWPDILSVSDEIISSDTWEGTRFCVDSSLPPEFRRLIAQEICAAYLEFGLDKKIGKIIGLMQTFILKSVFSKCGIIYEPLSKISNIGSFRKLQAAMMHVNLQQLENLRRATGLREVTQLTQNKYIENSVKHAA